MSALENLALSAALAAQALLPLGFAGLTARLACEAAAGWPARMATLAIAAAVAAAAVTGFALPNAATLAALGAVLAAAVLGSPVFTTLGGIALFLFWSKGLPIAAVA